MYNKTIKNDLLYLSYKRKHKKHNQNWPKIAGHPYRILIIDCSGSGNTNPLLSLM